MRKDEAQALVAEIGQAAAEAQAAIDEEQQLQSQIDAELESLIEQQRAAEAAARQAELEAAAAAQAAAQAAAPAAGTGGSGGASTGGGSPAPAPPPSSGGGSPAPAPPASGGGGSPTPAPPASGAAGAVAAAMSMQGVPYRWAGADPSGFDCSGLMMWAWARAGRSLPHSSAAQYGATRRISAGDLQPGDLVFYGSPIHHVSMYIGGGNTVHAPHTGDVVRTAPIGYVGSPVGYGRP